MVRHCYITTMMMSYYITTMMMSCYMTTMMMSLWHPGSEDRFTLCSQPRDHVFWKHTTTWNRTELIFIDMVQVQARILHRIVRPGALLMLGQYLHYLWNISGASVLVERLQHSGTSCVTLHPIGTLLGHDLVSVAWTIGISILGFSCMWHDTPGEYLECTRKLTATKTVQQTTAW
jgi:hypothetical protein